MSGRLALITTTSRHGVLTANGIAVMPKEYPGHLLEFPCIVVRLKGNIDGIRNEFDSMHKMRFRRTLGLLLVGIAWRLPPGDPACALTIALDFASGGYFNSNATAKATILQAAADISAANITSLAPIDQYSWMRSVGPTGGQSLTGTYDWQYTGNITSSLPANTVQFFVSAENIAGDTLGTGGSAGLGFSAEYGISFSGSINNAVLQSQFTSLVDQQSALAQNEFIRGAGPVIGTIAGTSELDFENGPPSPDATWNYSVNYGPAFGNLALDNSSPVGMTMEQYWHLDYNTPVAAGKNDLYSVALHEMLHALGVGSSVS